MKHSEIIFHAKLDQKKELMVEFDGDVVGVCSVSAAKKAESVRGNFALGVKKPFKPMRLKGSGHCVMVSQKANDSEGFALVILDNPPYPGAEVASFRVEDIRLPTDAA
ncbi:MAG: hypothetical protein CVV52_03715 [Spirochaetae bacterium HGW-Spirochaetae-8]|jgi:hypothetical protein|nr:MAG: hypothetical protein CVV52_03715 [Spirochaetae bacterium HGW-Spirochaetae-8]